ncbi:MauE/DoxX family redox-associated membrane protein [Neptunicella marina]|uniref:Methylamine utilization protein MauE n=1 Tax=Neptunicella marina TaxID=2125989 RepID=A0A8J6IVW1_9ALTE|nr:glutaredoxin [Neptunicella marina]MBC3767164.1 glutaredoxin [Neptunicella marina]
MSQTAVLYRMVSKEHICPFGLKAKDLLERQGYEVEDHQLANRDQTDKFKQQHDVDTTPQVFIGNKRVGGYSELRAYFDKPAEQDTKWPYTPVAMIFSIAALLSLILSTYLSVPIIGVNTLMHFIGFSMVLLALQKVQDIRAFTTMFITYDLLAMRYLRYAKIYPFIELIAGLSMLLLQPVWITALFALFIGTVGAVSVYKAVYIDERQLKCACVGGDSDVPLGFVSLTENLVMILGAVLMLVYNL